MIRRSDITVLDNGTTPEPGVYITVKTVTGALASIYDDAGNPQANPFTSDAEGGFVYNVPETAAGPYFEEYRLSLASSPRTVVAIDLDVDADVLSLYVASQIARAEAARDGAEAAEAATLDALAGTSLTNATLNAASLAALAALNHSLGLPAYLTQAGREGVFVWNGTGQSANVSADPYQGLYVPPTGQNGSSGAWVRVVQGLSYQLSWWNPVQLGANGHTVLNTVGQLLPDQATLHWGANVVTVSDNVVFPRGVHIRGLSTDASRLEADPANLSSVGTSFGSIGMLWLQMSNSSVNRIGFSGVETNVFANNPACIHWQTIYGTAGGVGTPGTIEQRTLDNLEVWGCEFDNTSLAIVTATSIDDNPATNNGVIVLPSTNVHIHHNTITTSQHGIEIFGSDYVDLHDNRILPSPNGGAGQFRAPIRILGSREVDVHDNEITGQSDDYLAQKGVYLSAAAFATNIRRANKNVRVKNNTAGGGIMQLVQIDECLGDCVIQDNRWFEDRASTALRTAIYVTVGAITNGLLPVVERVIVKGNTFFGTAIYFHWDSGGGTGKLIRSKGNTIVGNDWTPDVAGRMFQSVFSSWLFAEFNGDDFLMKDGGGFGFAFHNGAGKILRVVNCTFPEYSGASSWIDNDGTGTVVNSIGNSGEDPALGANSRYPAGAWALV